MWMAILKSYITGKYSEKRNDQQPTENQKNTKTEIFALWEPSFTFLYLACQGGYSHLLSRVSYATASH